MPGKLILDYRPDHISSSAFSSSNHLPVHEFVRSILENRPPCMDDIMGAYWTETGICAHQSAMRGGEEISIPAFEAVQ